MNPGTLNRATMLEHRIQHLIEIPKHMLEHWFQLTQTRIFVLAIMQPIQIPNNLPLWKILSYNKLRPNAKNIEGYRKPFLQVA